MFIDSQIIPLDELKTSEKWYELIKDKITILDPDGWDRTNWKYSFYEELISLETFLSRVMASTVEGNIKYIKNANYGQI
jgi:hypothetical protein